MNTVFGVSFIRGELLPLRDYPSAVQVEAVVLHDLGPPFHESIVHSLLAIVGVVLLGDGALLRVEFIDEIGWRSSSNVRRRQRSFSQNIDYSIVASLQRFGPVAFTVYILDFERLDPRTCRKQLTISEFSCCLYASSSAAFRKLS